MTLLVNHPAPYPDESLASYVERLARANHYQPPRLLSTWLRTPGSGGVLALARAMRQPELYRRLADLTGQSVTQLFALTVHRFISVLLPPETSVDVCEVEGQVLSLFLYRHVRLLLRPEEATAYCPACLRDALYHRLIWQVAAVAACPIHAAWLLDRCPACEHPLTAQAVAAGSCSHCHLDLREHDALSVSPIRLDETVLQAQQCLYAWLNGQAAPASLGLPTASGQALFRVLDGLRIAVQLRGMDGAPASGHGALWSPPADVRRRIAPQAAGYLYGAAFQGLKDWPDGFFAFLDAYRNHDETAQSGLNSLGTLYSTWLERHWQHPMFGFVQEAFNRYLTSHFPPVLSILQSKRLKRQPELVEQFAYVDVRNAARLTQTSPSKIHRLIRDGLLDIYPEKDPARPGVLLYREQVETLRDALAQIPIRPKSLGNVPGKPHMVQEFPEDMLTKTEAASYLGIQVELLNDLLSCGLLAPTGRRRRGEEHLPYLALADLEDWQERLKEWVQLQAPPARGSVKLPRAAVLNGKVGISQVKLLERILAGRLTAYHASPDLRPLRDLWFEEAVVLGLTQQVKDEHGWVSFLEAKALLDVGRQVLHRWVDRELIVPVASFARAQYFLLADVADLRERLVTSHEAALMLGTNRAAISQWVRAGYLQPLNGPGTTCPGRFLFDRAALEDWHRTFISTPEAKQMLGATDSMLRQWREQGQLVRQVTDPKMSGFYHRDEVLRLQQTLFQTSPAQKL
jgi:hypothetical protein